MKRIGIFGVAVAAALLAAGAGYWWSSGPDVPAFLAGGANAGTPDRPRAPPPAAVEVAPVAVERVAVRIDAIGTLAPGEAVVLAPEIDGTIAEIAFREGARVEAGEVLVRLDDAVLKAQSVQAQAQLSLAEANFERADALLRQQSGTQRARDEALAALQSARAAVALSQAQLDRTVIRAPFAGVLGLRSVSPGEYVNRGESLISLVTLDPLKVDFRVSETFLADIRLGQPVHLSVDAVPGRAFAGEIYAIDPQVDIDGRSLQVRARLANPAGELRPGLFARVAVEAAVRDDAMLIPEAAIIPQGDQRFVFRIEEGKARRVAVEIGLRQNGSVEIVKGLSKGDVVVTAGHHRLRDGALVEIVGKAGV